MQFIEALCIPKRSLRQKMLIRPIEYAVPWVNASTGQSFIDVKEADPPD
jgi:hypothetical protein